MTDMHNLYAFEWCRRRKCNLVYADMTDEEARKLAEVVYSSSKAKEKLKGIGASAQVEGQGLSGSKISSKNIQSVRAEKFVELMMDRVSPKFSVLPQPLDKTLVGIISPDLEEEVANQWKSKFATVYNHKIMEVNELDDEQEKAIIMEQNKKYD